MYLTTYLRFLTRHNNLQVYYKYQLITRVSQGEIDDYIKLYIGIRVGFFFHLLNSQRVILPSPSPCANFYENKLSEIFEVE